LIKTIEDNLIALVKSTLPNKLKEVKSLPGALNKELLKILMAASPAVYFAFLGGPRGRGDEIDGIWAMYMVTALGDEVQRRVGDARVMGAYDLIDILLPVVHEHNIPDVGSLKFKQVQNLFSTGLDKEGVTLYAATFSLPMPIEYQADLTQLDDFITYSADHSMAPGNDEPAAQDLVILDQ